MKAERGLQDKAYQEVRDSIGANQQNGEEQVAYYWKEGLAESPRPKVRNRSRESADNYFILDNETNSPINQWAQGDDVPRVVKRLAEKAQLKEENLSKMRQEQERIRIKELTHKPEISEYDYISLNRVPLHKRNYNTFAEKRNEEFKRNTMLREIQESESCTFAPNINKRKMDTLRAKTPTELIDWKKEKDNTLALLRMEKADIQGHECTFQPKINEKSKRMVARHNGGDGIPLRRTKNQFIEEYLKKEREELFKPKINVSSKKIIRGGYEKPAEIEVKQLKRTVRNKSAVNKKRTFSGDGEENSQNDRRYMSGMTAEAIIERYRREARPKRINVKRTWSVSGIQKKNHNINEIEVEAENYKAQKFFVNGRHTSKGESKEIVTPTKDNMNSNKKVDKRSASPVKLVHKEQSKLRSEQEREQDLCYRYDREPVYDQKFDNDFWMEYTKERNNDALKRKVEELIYRDSLEKKHPKVKRMTGKPSGMPLKQSHTAHK